jgi:hypothetical protein
VRSSFLVLIVLVACAKSKPVSLSILRTEWKSKSGCADDTLVISVSSDDAVTIRILDKDRMTGPGLELIEIPASEIGDRRSVTVTAAHKVGGRTRSEEAEVPVHIDRPMGLEPLSASGINRVHISATLRDGRTSEKSIEYSLSSTELEARFKGCGLKNPRVDVGTVDIVNGELVHRVDARELVKKGATRLKAKLQVDGGQNGTAEVKLDDEIDRERLLLALYVPTREGKAVPWAAARGPDSAILVFLGAPEIIHSGEIAFVAWVETTKETPAGTCQFEGPSGYVSLERKRVDQKVKVVEARTGSTLIERTFPGSTVPCPKSVRTTADATTNSALHGSVSYDTIRAWLATVNVR